MIRTQVQLTERQFEQLRELAHDRKSSIAGLVREAVDRYLGAGVRRTRSELLRASLEVAGAFTDGRGDVGGRHDDEFASAIDHA